jgi:hypothetical protein
MTLTVAVEARRTELTAHDGGGKLDEPTTHPPAGAFHTLILSDRPWPKRLTN